MQISSVNDVKIYNLSHGKSLPEWLSDRKKRQLQKKDVDIQRRIELIQDFEMPMVCTSIKVSRDGQFILATGTYKPRIRCYDTYQLSLKFERCLDSDVVAFDILSDDYSKLVFLHSDRYVEFHSQHGHYYKTRIPKFGRDFSYHYPSCDLYFVGTSSEVFRLNLEQGRFLNSLQTDAVENNVCDINPVHHLFATGTSEVSAMAGCVPDCDFCVFCLFVSGLSHLVGSSLLRAYMHGYFMDIRLYHKVKSMANPFAYEEYRKDKIRQKIEESRTQRVQVKKLPKVNKELALKLMEEGDDEAELASRKKKGKALPSVLGDDRFKVMFENPDYQVDDQSEEFRLLNPIVSKVGQKRQKKLRLLAQQAAASEQADEDDKEPEGRASSEEESSDDDKSWVEEVREQRRLIWEEGRDRRRQGRKEADRNTVLLERDQSGGEETSNMAEGKKTSRPQYYQIKAGEEFRSFNDVARKQRLQKASLEDRLKLEEHSGTSNMTDTAVGSKQLTFTLKKSEQQRKQQQAEWEHHEERRKLRRSAGHLSSDRGRGRGGGGRRGRGGGSGRGRGGGRGGGRGHY
ncbi:nucleolar protein 10 [Anarrhichthys ocellatus]|uniref:nucleolar protein 10 n=1 Tax=Anarrhichthys ocellatus TaxID=433405 RepID=UPI0012EE9308|nr:nucleolar protein 10-like [Anarrhichthys ocellatus]